LAFDSARRAAATDAERHSYRQHFARHFAIAYATFDQALDHRMETTAETFTVAQVAQASSASRAIAGMAARFAAGSDALAVVVREHQDLAQHLEDLDAAIVEIASKKSQEPAERGEGIDSPIVEAATNGGLLKQPEATAIAALRMQYSETEARLEVLDGRINRAFPRFAQLSNPKPLPLRDAQALLAPDEAMLVYFVGTDVTWLWSLQQDRVQLYRIEIDEKSLAQDVELLRSALDPITTRILRRHSWRRMPTPFTKRSWSRR
jgi:hypothetical protein